MSQPSTWSVPTSGPATPEAYATRDNDSLNALLTTHLGAFRPGYAARGTIWSKDTGDSPAVDELYYYDGTNDAKIGSINRSTGVFTPEGVGGDAFTFDNVNGRLGINQGSPDFPLDVVSENSSRVAARFTSGIASGEGGIQIRSGDGSTTDFYVDNLDRTFIDYIAGGNFYVSRAGIRMMGITGNVSTAQFWVGGNAPDTNAGISLTSTTRGMKSSTVTTAQRTAFTTAAADAGMFTWDSDLNAWCVFDGSAWNFPIYRPKFVGPQVTAPVALSYSAITTIDMNDGAAREITLTGNVTFANPTNLVAGQEIILVIRQDATGNRTAAWGSYFKFPGGSAPTLSAGANAVDIITGYAVSATEILCVANLGMA